MVILPLPGNLVPLPGHPFSGEIAPNTQSKPLVTWLVSHTSLGFKSGRCHVNLWSDPTQTGPKSGFGLGNSPESFGAGVLAGEI